MGKIAPTPPDGKRGPGRPPKAPEDRAHSYKSKLTLSGHIPVWIGYEDLKALIRAYRGRMYDERNFKLWVEQGVVPSFFEKNLKTAVPSVRRRTYHWLTVTRLDGTIEQGVRDWIDSQMQPAPRSKGIIFNGEFQPTQPPSQQTQRCPA